MARCWTSWSNTTEIGKLPRSSSASC
jgi:hypothetical protein